ncbi:nuclear pore complex protein DDB_G0274915 [Aplysia californica]|uniref:Nuclear pore complex protein DDB_G0274915 n=1 Tax=Aplysia californica TaxID=6500 RepID=A0ABM0K7Z4_APLCA|nr:nuclear pore complex protein DDB_G0274915 [Aplysia californica]
MPSVHSDEDKGKLTGETMSIGTPRRSSSSSSSNGGGRMGKRPGKRPGRKPSKIDEHAKLERSRQSARECRARKKLRYQYLEELVLNREKAVFALRDELETFKQWCIQLDGGGAVPEPLMKLIVNEDLKQKKRQMEEATRSLQQQQTTHRVPSSSSSSSPSSSPPHATDSLHQQQQSQQWQQLQQHRQRQQQQQLGEISRDSQATLTPPQQVSNVSNPQQQLHSLRTGSLPVGNTRVTPPLRRQMAVDLPQSSMRAYNPNLEHFIGSQKLQQKPPSTVPSADVLFPSQNPSGSGSANVARVRSEPPLRYEYSMDTSTNSTYCNMDTPTGLASMGFSTNLAPVSSRGRSLSNPMSMASASRPLQAASQAPPSRNTLTNQQRGNMLSQSLTPPPGSQQAAVANRRPISHQSVGLFSGSALTGRSSLSAMNLPITVEDSSSSDDNSYPEQPLFRSATILSQKRTLSDPALQMNLKRTPSSTAMAGMSSTTSTTPLHAAGQQQQQQLSFPLGLSAPSSSSVTYDPHTTLSNLTNVHCFSATRTSNTPSPAPYSFIPVGQELVGGAMASPAPSSAHSHQPSTTPSSSNTPSPAPLLSLTSFLELSASSLPSTTSDEGQGHTSQTLSGVPNFLQVPRGSTLANPCTSTGLSASISEPIPEWYSFLADLQDGGMSLTSRHGASSGQGTPNALTPRPGDQPATPESASSSSFMNVPNIIEDLLDDSPNT